MPAARIADTTDAEAVAALLVEFRDWIGRAEPGREGTLASVRRLLDDPSAEFLLAGDPVEAVCQLRYRHSVWTGTDDCEIEDLFVREGARGGGLGRLLVTAALERARARGCGRILLDTGSSNAPALALYRSFGFDGDDVRLRRPL
ncbi:MAG: GNAT family N-acetyltransferase [Thermoleophilaceae bacterium]|nr:GNAT family N-acetyltransferase [Thermoleophilaceae bacterium]